MPADRHRSGLILGLAAVALAALALAAGWGLGHWQRQAGPSGAQVQLEHEIEVLQRRFQTGQASDAERQRLLELLVGLERRAEATALVAQLAQQQPQRWRLRLLLAELRREQNDLSGAERELQQLFSRQPDQLEALQLLASLQLETGRGSQAQLRLEAALNRASKPKLQPQALQIGLLLANLQLKRGQAAQAQALLSRLASDFPQDPRPLLARALVEQERGQLVAAQASLAAARALTPGKGDQRLDRLAAAWGIQALRNPKDTNAKKPSADKSNSVEANSAEANAVEANAVGTSAVGTSAVGTSAVGANAVGARADEAKGDEPKAD
jgi:tetratricopeptide (TPR) repeat protein